MRLYVGASIHPKGPKGTQKDPKGTQKDPKGPKRNPKELKTDFSYMIKVLVLFKKKDKIFSKSRMTKRLIFGHLFFIIHLQCCYIYTYLFHTSTLFNIPFFTLYEIYVM